MVQTKNIEKNMLTHREYKQLVAALHGMRKYEDGSYILSPNNVLALLKTYREDDEQSADDICSRRDDRGSEGEQG